MSKQPKTYFVRVKPYNKRRGYLCRNFMVGGKRFSLRWTEVSAAKAKELEEMTQPHDRDAEIPLFDIVTKEKAQAIEQEERDADLKPVYRVKDAERVPDRAFRDDKPKIDEETGEIFSDVEPAETVEKSDDDPAEEPEEEVAPAPSLRGGRRKAKTRS